MLQIKTITLLFNAVNLPVSELIKLFFFFFPLSEQQCHPQTMQFNYI